MERNIRNLVSCEDLSIKDIDSIFSLALKIKQVLRKVKKFSTLRGKSVFTIFYEPSTRTRASFELAGKLLSADVINIAASFSSVKKGESLKDTLKTIDMMHPDIIVLRHPCEGAAHIAGDSVGAHVVNAGDGCHEHPSQALIDAFTVKLHKESISGLNIVVIGDILHSRVARSDAILFNKLGARVFVWGPSTLMPRYPDAIGVEVLGSLGDVFDIADVVILLRVQFERLDARRFLPSIGEYAGFFGLNAKRLKLFKKDVIILHPGPVNRGIEVNNDVMEFDRTLILDQVANGLVVRMAILLFLCGMEDVFIKEYIGE